MYQDDDTDYAVAPTEAQEISDSKADLAKLLSTLTLLKDFQSQMNPETGICRDEVKALISNCQIGLDERFPMESFTVIRSPQNYQAVTESILRRAGEIVMDFFKKLIELIRKGVTWLIRAIKALFGREAHVKATVAKTADMVAANDEADVVLRTTPAAAAPAEPQTHGPVHAASKVAELTQRHEAALAAYAACYNGIAEAMLTEKGFIGQIRFLGLKLPELLYHVEKRLDSMRAAMDDVTDKLKFTGHLNNMLALVIEPSWFHNKGGEIAEMKDATKAETIGAYMQILEDLIRRLKNEKPAGQADWHVAAKVVINPDTGFADPFVMMQSHLSAQADVLEKRVMALSAPLTMDGVFDRHPDLRNLYDRVVGQLTDEFYAVLRFFDVAVMVTETQARLASAIYNLEATAYQLKLAKAEETQNPELIKRLNTIQQGLREKVSKWSKDL